MPVFSVCQRTRVKRGKGPAYGLTGERCRALIGQAAETIEKPILLWGRRFSRIYGIVKNSAFICVENMPGTLYNTINHQPNGGSGMSGAMEYLRQLNIWSMMLRLALAVALGGIIGIERERKGRAAGFRTYMLVALGATVTMLLNQYFSVMVEGPWAGLVKEVVHTDVSRLGAQVINGVGFLGAGTIIVTHRQEIQGLTTAAGLWASACMGLAIGAGFYECMLAAVVLILLCMVMFSRVEAAALSKARSMNIYVEMQSINGIGAVTSLLKGEGCRIYDVELCSPADRAGGPIGAVFTVGLDKKQGHMDLLVRLSAADGLVKIEEN